MVLKNKPNESREETSEQKTDIKNLKFNYIIYYSKKSLF